MILTAKADSTLTSSIYRVRVTAASGTTILHSRIVDVRVPANADFSLGASPGELRTRATDSNSTTIIAKSENGFTCEEGKRLPKITQGLGEAPCPHSAVAS